MLPVLFRSDQFILYSYPLLMGVAWGVGIRIYADFLYKFQRHAKEIYSAILIIFLFAWLGAKLLFYFVNVHFLPDGVLANHNFWMGGGFVFYGGLLGGLLAVLLLWLTKRLTFKELELLVIPLTLSHAIGRVGCLFAGCCYGKEIWNFKQPVPLYESLALVVLFLILRKKEKEKLPMFGLTQIYLIGYSSIRFVLEFLRGDDERGLFLGGIISTSQIISLMLILGVIVLRFFFLPRFVNRDN